MSLCLFFHSFFIWIATDLQGKTRGEEKEQKSKQQRVSQYIWPMPHMWPCQRHRPGVNAISNLLNSIFKSTKSREFNAMHPLDHTSKDWLYTTLYFWLMIHEWPSCHGQYRVQFRYQKATTHKCNYIALIEDYRTELQSPSGRIG